MWSGMSPKRPQGMMKPPLRWAVTRGESAAKSSL